MLSTASDSHRPKDQIVRHSLPSSSGFRALRGACDYIRAWRGQRELAQDAESTVRDDRGFCDNRGVQVFNVLVSRALLRDVYTGAVNYVTLDQQCDMPRTLEDRLALYLQDAADQRHDINACGETTVTL